jgi:CNT family concentrative nucleoside transporter
MGTVSGAILAVFGEIGVPMVHLLTASVMAIPGSLLIAKILYPEDSTPKTLHGAGMAIEKPTGTVFDALSTGTTDGMYLALNVGAMLISFLSLIELANIVLSRGSAYANIYLADFGLKMPLLSLSYLFSYIFAPFGYLLGFSGNEALKAGELLGTKVTINELIAYTQMVKMNLSARTVAVMTYALCGFSNFSCIGIQIGGIGALVPEKRKWLCELGLYAVLGGSLSNLLSALIAGLLL